LRESGGIFHQNLSPWMRSHTVDTYLLKGVLGLKDSGKMGRDPCWEVHPRALTLIVEVHDDAGWVSDGVDEVSGDHFVREERFLSDQREAMHDEPSHPSTDQGYINKQRRSPPLLPPLSFFS
jgi:hypothetical protein